MAGGVTALRSPALFALALPVLAGLAYMVAFDAPRNYLAVNALTLLAGAVWTVFGGIPAGTAPRRIIVLVLLALLALPLLTGPQFDGVARWIPAGPVTLHAGMLTVPAIALLAAGDRRYGPWLLTSAVLVCAFQPDTASALALTCAAAGIAIGDGDRRFGVVAIIGLITAAAAARAAELPPQAFVEHVIVDAAHRAPVAGFGLAFALAGSVFVICRFMRRDRDARFGIAGALIGFAAASMIANYPTPLIGYGASAILGFALALGLRKRIAP